MNALLDGMRRTFDAVIETCTAKNGDYANDTDPYHNFRGSERIGIAMDRGIMMRVQDKFQRLENLMTRKSRVRTETVDDTILDLIGYLAIMRDVRSHKNEDEDRLKAVAPNVS